MERDHPPTSSTLRGFLCPQCLSRPQAHPVRDRPCSQPPEAPTGLRALQTPQAHRDQCPPGVRAQSPPAPFPAGPHRGRAVGSQRPAAQQPGRPGVGPGPGTGPPTSRGGRGEPSGTFLTRHFTIASAEGSHADFQSDYLDVLELISCGSYSPGKKKGISVRYLVAKKPAQRQRPLPRSRVSRLRSCKHSRSGERRALPAPSLFFTQRRCLRFPLLVPGFHTQSGPASAQPPRPPAALPSPPGASRNPTPGRSRVAVRRTRVRGWDNQTLSAGKLDLGPRRWCEVSPRQAHAAHANCAHEAHANCARMEMVPPRLTGLGCGQGWAGASPAC